MNDSGDFSEKDARASEHSFRKTRRKFGYSNLRLRSENRSHIRGTREIAISGGAFAIIATYGSRGSTSLLCAHGQKTCNAEEPNNTHYSQVLPFEEDDGSQFTHTNTITACAAHIEYVVYAMGEVCGR